MISLIIPPKDMIARVNKMLGDEYGTASNIKSRVNRSLSCQRMHFVRMHFGSHMNVSCLEQCVMSLNFLCLMSESESFRVLLVAILASAGPILKCIGLFISCYRDVSV